jgi:hypothetical protein
MSGSVYKRDYHSCVQIALPPPQSNIQSTPVPRAVEREINDDFIINTITLMLIELLGLGRITGACG